jgi:excisionase family DNA binding protein
MTTDDLPDVLTIDETARILRISRGLAFAGARRGDIPAIRIGRRLLVPRAALMRLLRDEGDGARQ